MKTTQTDIAGQAGISQPFLSKILAGTKAPSWASAKRLAETTSTNPVDWMEGRVRWINRRVTVIHDGSQDMPHSNKNM